MRPPFRRYMVTGTKYGEYARGNTLSLGQSRDPITMPHRIRCVLVPSVGRFNKPTVKGFVANTTHVTRGVHLRFS